MKAGVSKSGSPAPRFTTATPAARNARARADTAIVADSLSVTMFGEGANSGINQDGVGGGTRE
jgi:hypothetical protein